MWIRLCPWFLKCNFKQWSIFLAHTQTHPLIYTVLYHFFEICWNFLWLIIWSIVKFPCSLKRMCSLWFAVVGCSILYKTMFVSHVVQFFYNFTETGVLKFSTWNCGLVYLSFFVILCVISLCNWMCANLELLYLLGILCFYHYETFYFLEMLALKPTASNSYLHQLYFGLYYILHILCIHVSLYLSCISYKQYIVGHF